MDDMAPKASRRIVFTYSRSIVIDSGWVAEERICSTTKVRIFSSTRQHLTGSNDVRGPRTLEMLFLEPAQSVHHCPSNSMETIRDGYHR